jgi:ferredoxin-NADP reductase
MSKRYEVEFLGCSECGADIVSCRFSKPEGYTFTAGQYMSLTLQTVEGDQTKPFTHSQAPADPYLELTTRLSGSAFKNELASLREGQVVRIAGPSGKMVLPEGIDTIAFLVGGVGITPARSMLRDAWQRGFLWKDAVVFYGNRDVSCMPFADELAEMLRSGVRVVNVLERAEESWAGYRGFVNAQIVRENLDPFDGRLFCVSGPPAMVVAMEGVLDELGIERGRRLIERFGIEPLPPTMPPG